MSSSVNHAGLVPLIPASLSFLAIYNPSLSHDEDSLHDQIVYYYSASNNAGPRRQSLGNAETGDSREEKNERLRQIGLAQGMVEFAKSFSNGEAVDSIETEKSRIILHELEAGWWILASIDLTRIISSADPLASKHASNSVEPTIEYSSREVCPPALVLQHIIRAHRVFLLHHSPALAVLHARLTRRKFCDILKSFWDSYIWNWDVLLHGNPAVEVFNALKLAAGGELGIGVGEEEWGSGEREVLEGFIERTDGLVDLVVSRFGDAPNVEEISNSTSTSATVSLSAKGAVTEWPGAGQLLRPSDGVIFSGVGAISRSSVRDISSWTEWLYKYGQNAYGLRDNPSSTLRRKRKVANPSNAMSGPSAMNAQGQQRIAGTLQHSNAGSSTKSGQDLDTPADIPASIVAPARIQRPKASVSPDARRSQETTKQGGDASYAVTEDSASGTETLMKYLTLGVYGTKWSILPAKPKTSRHTSNLQEGSDVADPKSRIGFQQGEDLSCGYFMIGLQGDLEQDGAGEDEAQDTEIAIERHSSLENQSSNNRTMLRTLHVKRATQSSASSRDTLVEHGKESVPENYFDRLRVVVYVQQPFIFTFLFELQTDSLAIPSFYRSLHYQLGPLQRPLLASTSPRKVSERLWEASAPKSTASTHSSQPICELVYDPSNLTVHTTIPNIPEPGVIAGHLGAAPWTRVEALTVHSQILNTYTSTRRHTSEVERTCKTNRGWWVVWMRLPHPHITQPTHSSSYREAFLIRKASDYIAPTAGKTSGRLGRDVSDSNASSRWGPGKLAEGIGIDARQYIEGLLSLNR